jgi:hypothetical protein
MRRRARLALALSALLAWPAVSCRQVSPLPPEALVDVWTLDQFREIFNAQVDKARLLVLLAPT